MTSRTGKLLEDFKFIILAKTGELSTVITENFINCYYENKNGIVLVLNINDKIIFQSPKDVTIITKNKNI